MKTYGIEVILICLLLPLCCGAVKPYTPRIADPMLEPWRWREVKELNGLGVLCMDQAPDGAYWFGGIGCIARYDGMDVKTTQLDDELVAMITRGAPTLPRVRAILMHADDEPLAVIGRSLVVREQGHWRVVIPDVGDAHVETRMEQSTDGTIWLMSRAQLWHISEDLSAVQMVASSPGKCFFTAFCLEGEQRIWLTKTTPQQRVDLIEIPLRGGRPLAESQWNSRAVPVKRPGIEAGVAVGPAGTVWVADNIGINSLYGFNPETQRWETVEDQNQNRNFFKLTTVKNGTVWAGGYGYFYALRNGEPGYYSREKLGLPAVPVELIETDDDRWWVIGRIGHVYYLDRGYKRWRTLEGLHFEYEAPDGDQWFLTPSDTVVSFDAETKEWREHEVRDGLVEHALSITASSHGLIWVGGSLNGRAAISVYDGETWVRFLHPEFAAEASRVGAWESDDGTLWFSAGGHILVDPPHAGGALQYGVREEGTPYLIQHHAPPVLPFHVGGIAQTKDETMWFGAPTVRRWNAGEDQSRQVHDIPVTATQDLVVDADDSLWVAKLGSGVYRLLNGEWGRVTPSAGPVSDHVADLLLLQDGSLMAASDQGISRFDGRSWSAHVFSQDFAMANSSGKMRQSPGGALWFNFSEMDPRSTRVIMNVRQRVSTVRYLPETQPPETEITHYLERVSQPGNTYISWQGRDPFSETPPDRLHYSWRFNGGEWSEFSDETGRTFLEVGDGEQVFEVRARDRDFNIDPSPARVAFVVTPPVWKQAWFILMGVLVVGLSALVLVLVIWHREHRLMAARNRSEERAKHLAEVDQLKTGFFTNISHELNTPLTLVLGPLERILKRETEPAKRTLLKQAMRNVKRVANLTAQLLDFRRLEMGKLSVERVRGDVAVCVDDTVLHMEPLAEAKGVRCIFQGVETLDGWFDDDKLRKIVRNLVGNAIKYTPKGGEVTVRLGAADHGRELELVVEDSGPGIASEHLLRIFERFYRVPEKHIVDGSGIGLNLTKELVELWGGRITVESPAREHPDLPGSRFRVILPIHLPQEKSRDE